MSAVRTVAPFLLATIIAICASALLARADHAAGEATMRQVTGLNRGAILDRNGVPLAVTANLRGTATRLHSIPGLATTVGYQDPAGNWHGLESRYGGFLTASQAQGDWRTFFLNLRGQSTEGGTVHLTLDQRVQKAAEAALGQERGAVVALDPRSGDVLALASTPSCSVTILRNNRGYGRCLSDSAQPLLNRATQLLVPPGSIFKIVTLSAALDTRRFGLGSIFAGADAFGPSPYFDNRNYPSNVTRADLTELTLPQALAFSDNFAFAHIGLTLGARTLLRYARRFYVGRRIPFVYPVAVSQVAAGRSHPSPSVVARSSFGATTDQVTPLQMALVAAGVANGGAIMAPHLLKELRTSTGRVTYRFSDHQLSRVMSKRAAREVTDAMVFVVQHGSGYRAQIEHAQVAGKTGTAASGANRPHAWFISFAPASHPVVAVAVLHEYSGEAFKFAAPIARAVMVAALRAGGYHVK